MVETHLTDTFNMSTPTDPKSYVFDYTNGLLCEAPSLCTNDDCEGCGELKTYRGQIHSSMVCCNKCWRKLPKWMRDAFAREPGDKWENRIAATLIWMGESLDAE
jgi:hypothetical protein